MSERRPVMRPVRVQKRPSFLKTVLFYVALLIVSSAVTSALFFPTSLEDFALVAVIAMAFETIGLLLHALWARITRKRRREELMG